jgi:Cu+-exporting ATPase
VLKQRVKVQLEIEGMMCQNNCGTTVKNALLKVDGVLSVEVSFPRKSASIVLSEDGKVPALIDMVEAVGFDATHLPESPTPSGKTICLAVEGMMCQKNCGTTVQNALSRVAHVKSVEVSFLRKCAVVQLEAGTTATPSIEATLVDAVDIVGFDASVMTGQVEVKLSVEGMMCQKNCGTTVQNSLASVGGVLAAEVSFPDKSATVLISLQPNETVDSKVLQLIDTVECVGFDAALMSAPNAQAVPNSSPSPKKGPSKRSLEAAEKVKKSQDKFGLGPPDSGTQSYMYSVEGVSCAACVGKIEKALIAMPSVKDAAVNLSTGQVQLHRICIVLEHTKVRPILIFLISSGPFCRCVFSVRPTLSLL